jgi:hypothetical protein
MTSTQTMAFYGFLEAASTPFSLNEIVSHIQAASRERGWRLADEVAFTIEKQHLAFPLGGPTASPGAGLTTSEKKKQRWISRRGYFEAGRFVIKPTRFEFENNVLIPGHRCVPFAAPNMLPAQFHFFWKNQEIPMESSEATPEEIYPYYAILGEEFAPQMVMKDSEENMETYHEDPYEEPELVSIKTLNMSKVYPAMSFKLGDMLAVRVLSWREGNFELEKVAKDEWSEEQLAGWVEAAEKGFSDSFYYKGPLDSTDQQIAYAYWYGGARMRDLPALPLEDFLYEKTDHIETVDYGIESRFWLAGHVIPDTDALEDIAPVSRSVLVDAFTRAGVPLSEYIIHSYAADSIFREEEDSSQVLARIAPPPITLSQKEQDLANSYIREVWDEIKTLYKPYLDRISGPVRQRAAEIHTSAVALAARIRQSGMDSSRLPRHCFIILSQIQKHASQLLEELLNRALGEGLDEALDLTIDDSSEDNMLYTLEQLKDDIEQEIHAYRQNTFSLVKPRDEIPAGSTYMRVVELSLNGADVWRRICLDDNTTLETLRTILCALFCWDGERTRVNSQGVFIRCDAHALFNDKASLKQLREGGFYQVRYETEGFWTVQVTLMSGYDAPPGEKLHCIKGQGASPPAFIESPVQYRRFLYNEDYGNISRYDFGGQAGDNEALSKQTRERFDAEHFDLDECNALLEKLEADGDGSSD